jgi:hypothetical protein
VRKCFWVLMSTALVTALFGAAGSAAQDPQSGGPKAGPLIPLKVQIVVSRYQGEKKVSSLPYTLTVNANDGFISADGRFNPFKVAQLRTGASVPVPALASPKEGPMGPMGPVQYKAIGTNIDCTAQSTADGRFRVDISIEDTSVYSEGQTAQGVAKLDDIPSFRTFQSSNSVILKDGQSAQFTAAADRINGEVTKVDVTVTVVK